MLLELLNMNFVLNGLSKFEETVKQKSKFKLIYDLSANLLVMYFKYSI